MRANIVRVPCCDLGHEPIHRFFWPIVLGTTINPSAAIAQIPHSQKIPMSVARNRSWDSEGWLIITESGTLFNEDDKELFSAISITCRRQNERTSYASSSFLYKHVFNQRIVCSAEFRKIIWTECDSCRHR